jgi:hypothetical protein
MCTCNPLAGYRCPEHRSGSLTVPSTPTSEPTSDAGWIDFAGTELTAEQKIRADALHEAVTFGHLFECPEDDPIDFALTAAKRFEAYIRDGAK